MAFWDVFKQQTEEANQSQLYYELRQELPDMDEDRVLIIACAAGLMARVAYVDFRLDAGELRHIEKVLRDWTTFDEELAALVARTAISHVKELAGMENHLYVYPLRDVLDKDSRYRLVEALFALAAADGSVENLESEEIRLIAKGLELSDRHFLSALAKVADSLRALR